MRIFTRSDRSERFYYVAAHERLRPKSPAVLVALILTTMNVTVFGLDQKGVGVGGNAVRTSIHDPAKPADIRLSALAAWCHGSCRHHPVRGLAARPHLQPQAQHQGGWQPGVVCIWHGECRKRVYRFPGYGTQCLALRGNGRRRVPHEALQPVAAGTVALVMVFFTNALAYLPTAALAGIVANAVLNLIEVEELREFWHLRRSEFWVAAVCLLSVLVWAITGCRHCLSDGQMMVEGLPARRLGA